MSNFVNLGYYIVMVDRRNTEIGVASENVNTKRVNDHLILLKCINLSVWDIILLWWTGGTLKLV
jgi:hypothetical protein